MERGEGQKGKGSSPDPAGSASPGNEQLPCPRLPRWGGEGFSSTEGLQVRHQKADREEQVIFIPMNSALAFHLENPWIILLFPRPVSHKRWGDLGELGSVGLDRNQVQLYLISAGEKNPLIFFGFAD